MNKKLAFSLVASALLGTTALAVAAPDCSKVDVPGNLSVMLAPNNTRFPIVSAVAHVDVPQQNVCYDIKGNGLKGQMATTVSPAHFCINLADKNAASTKVTLSFADKTTQDITPAFSIASVKKVYATALQTCEGAKAGAADSEGASRLSLPRTQKGSAFGL